MYNNIHLQNHLLVFQGQTTLFDQSNIIRKPFCGLRSSSSGANKLVDSCYSFWQGAIFPLLHEAFRQSGKQPLPVDHCWFQPEPLQMYILLACQHPSGGFLAISATAVSWTLDWGDDLDWPKMLQTLKF